MQLVETWKQTSKQYIQISFQKYSIEKDWQENLFQKEGIC